MTEESGAVKRPREDEENGVSVSVDMEDINNNNNSNKETGYISSVIPGWFSEISPMWPGNIKLNADGCVKASLGKAGFGGLFRDAKSSWILGYSGKLDVATSLEAEIWAIYRGTTIIHEKGWRNVIIETDCQDAVNLINGRAHPNCPYRALVEDIKFLTSRMDCIIKHIFREANQCADALAHMGENQVEDLKIYEDPPILLRPILVADMVGIVYERD